MALGWSLMGTWATIEMESSSKRKRSRKLTSSWFGKFSESSLVEHTSNGSYQSVIHSKNWSFFLPPIEIRNPVSVTKYSSTTICQKMPLKKHKKTPSLPPQHPSRALHKQKKLKFCFLRWFGSHQNGPPKGWMQLTETKKKLQDFATVVGTNKNAIFLANPNRNPMTCRRSCCGKCWRFLTRNTDRQQTSPSKSLAWFR